MDLIDTIAITLFFIVGSWIAISFKTLENRIVKLEDMNSELKRSLRYTGEHGFKLFKYLGEIQGMKLVTRFHMLSDEPRFEEMSSGEKKAYRLRKEADTLLDMAKEIEKE